MIVLRLKRFYKSLGWVLGTMVGNPCPCLCRNWRYCKKMRTL